MAWWSSALTPSREGARSIPNPGTRPLPHSRDRVPHPSSEIWLAGSVRFSTWLNWFQKIGQLAKNGDGTARTRSTKKNKKKKNMGMDCILMRRYMKCGDISYDVSPPLDPPLLPHFGNNHLLPLSPTNVRVAEVFVSCLPCNFGQVAWMVRLWITCLCGLMG